MYDRRAIMKAAWAQYRRENGTSRFDRDAFRACLRQRWAAVRLVGNRTAIMVAAWTRYRTVAATGGYDRFDRRLFGRILRMAWIEVRAAQDRADRERRAAAALRSVAKRSPREIELDAALETVRYLPAHMSAARAEAAIRARFAAHA